ncbi:MAG: SDR family oxidoreductase [Desulfobacterales bacterium]
MPILLKERAVVHIPTTVKNKDLVTKRRNQIVLAAIKLFSHKGFHKTTLKELAEEAGLSYGNIYDYVGSKEDIFFLIHDFLASSSSEVLNKCIEGVHDPLEKLRRMVRGEFNLQEKWADAVLLLYQEIHILEGNFLRKLLQREREHLEMFEAILEECVAKGQMKPCNLRLVSNLIKVMIDGWTIKRWDLRGHASQIEAEKTIMKIISSGLLAEDPGRKTAAPDAETFSGKTALIINGGTVIGQALCQALSDKGGQIVVHADPNGKSRGYARTKASADLLGKVRFLDQEKVPTPEQITELENQYGPVDFYLHDLGISTTEEPADEISKERARTLLEQNLRSAHKLADYLKTRMGSRTVGRIVYLAPWAWDFHADPIGFDIARAGASALTQSLSKQLAPSNVNVNCIVPGYIRGIRPFKIEKAMRRELLQSTPSGRLGEVFDVAEAVFFLLQDGSKYLTGQVLHVTGGQ